MNKQAIKNSLKRGSIIAVTKIRTEQAALITKGGYGRSRRPIMLCQFKRLLDHEWIEFSHEGFYTRWFVWNKRRQAHRGDKW